MIETETRRLKKIEVREEGAVRDVPYSATQKHGQPIACWATVPAA